jgi:hypothetical protein
MPLDSTRTKKPRIPQCIRHGQCLGRIGTDRERLAIVATHGHSIDGKRGLSLRQRFNLPVDPSFRQRRDWENRHLG